MGTTTAPTTPSVNPSININASSKLAKALSSTARHSKLFALPEINHPTISNGAHDELQ